MALYAILLVILGCKITACQMTFSGQTHCLSGHTDICMEKISGQSFSKLKSNYWKLMIVCIMTRILALCPDNSINIHGNFIMP